MKRGEIWVASLEPNKGAEVGKQRPVLIVQTNFLNDVGHPTVIILPITSREQSENLLRFRIEIPTLHRGIGYVLIDQIRSIDVKQRLKKKIGELSGTEMTAVGQLMFHTLELG